MLNERSKKKKSRNQNPQSNDLLNDKFKYLVNSVLESVRKDTTPFIYDKKEIFLGKHLIRKEDNTFVVYDKGQVVSGEPYYFLLESAMLVSFSMQKNNNKLLGQVMQLDKNFTKYYLDCLHLHRAIQAARAEGDKERADALIDKYQCAKVRRDYFKKLVRSLCQRNVNKR